MSKTFGDRVAYSGITFDVAKGEVFGFLGPNGAGKTTTVRTLGTLILPTSGRAEVAGLALLPSNSTEIRKRIAIMPESPGLYLKLSVEDNLRCFADLYELPDARERIAWALDATRISDRSKDQCGSLSKGLRQRAALARSLLNRPEILFLDEPSSGLDPAAALDVHALIKDLKDQGVTIFLTTHRLAEAEKLCDRVAILNSTIRSTGSPEELRDQLFARSLQVSLKEPLENPAALFESIGGVANWSSPGGGTYVVGSEDPRLVAPELTRALVRAGADVLSLSVSQHTLEDVYMKMISDNSEENLR